MLRFPSSNVVQRFLTAIACLAIVFSTLVCGRVCQSLGQDEPKIAATVANQIVSVKQVETFLAKTLDDRPLSDDVKILLQAKALDQLVGQLLVVEYLRGESQLVSDDDVQLAQERLQDELNSVGHKLDEYLEANGLTSGELQNRFRFRLSWAKYLDATLTEENVRKHFERHRRELDGSQVHVTHLLLKADKSDPAKWPAIQAKAEKIREQVLQNELSWSDAIRQNSEGASSQDGGDLGWIGRWSPMPESFSQAAFALEKEQISQPIRTEFGFHLIRCEEIKPGSLRWEEIEPTARRHAMQYLFDWIVTKQLPRTPPKYSGLYPYLDAATGRPVPAK